MIDERIVKVMDDIKAIAEQYGEPFHAWEDDHGWFCSFGVNGTVESTIYWFVIDLDDVVQVSHRGTTPGCLWTDWEPV